MSQKFLDIVGKDRFLEVCEKATSITEVYRTFGIDYRTFKATAQMLGKFEELQEKLKATSRVNTSPKGKTFAVKTKNGYKVDPLLWCQEVFEGKIIPSHPYRFKNRLIAAGLKEDKCDCCGITNWNGKPITLQCHHIDGDETNNVLENIQFLCPNCHSQTDNYLSKNKKKKL